MHVIEYTEETIWHIKYYAYAKVYETVHAYMHEQYVHHVY